MDSKELHPSPYYSYSMQSPTEQIMIKRSSISELHIFQKNIGDWKSFNMTDEMREPCLKALFEKVHILIKMEEDDETVVNMLERYEDYRVQLQGFR